MRSLLFVLSLICFCSQTTLSWKKEEFRSCDQTPFCKRARSRTPGACSLIVGDVSITDGDLVAKLLLNQEDGDQIKPLVLSLTVYKDGIVRLRVDEDHTLNPPKKRFRVPDVVVSEFEEKKIWLQKLATETISGDTSPSSVVYVSDGYEAVVRHDPFEVYVREKSGDRRRVVSLNSHGLFDFEQLGKKTEGDNWEEKFRTHTDSRPFGPQSISFDVSFYDSSFVYGIPEHATSFALKPTKGPGVEESEPYRLFNLDVFEYDHESPFGLYGSIPFMVSHGKSGKTCGFFWLNAAEMQIDVLANGWDAESGISLPSSQSRIDTLWMSEAGIVDTFFFVGPEPKDVVKQYASVTGTSAMPQLFATGYHQCRWNYKDEEDVAQVDSKFDEHDIPYDVLWLDIEHTDGKRYFTWDSVLFPHPEEMQKKLAAKGRKMVTIVDPHIKRDDSYFLHKEATHMGHYVKDSSGKDFDGWCWPGSSSYIDMLSPEIREWWGGRFSYKNYAGSTPSLYIWNDMNEPSVFNGPEVTMPRDALHVGGVEHREVHNAYGYYFHMATSDGLVMRGEGKDRPFVLSRAIFPGTQRYGAIWTGDNTAEWEHLRVSIPMILTLGLTGITFSGADIGGFFGNPEPELLVRWYQVGAYYPFFRGHAHHDTKRREPWLFGERNTELMRDAIHTRYMLLPYFYTLFREANVTGVPVVRPLWMEFPQDEATFSNDEAFMVGDGLLVQGVYTKGTTHASVYLPGKESWFDLRNGKTYVGGKTHKMDAPEESIPAFQKAGTIIPRKDRFRRSSSQMDNDPYTLVVALNSSQEAAGELYIDDGKSFEFRRGAYIHRRFVFSNGVLTSTNLAPPQARLSSQCLIDRIILLGHSSGPKSALVEPLNQKAEIEMGPLRMGGLVASSGTKVLTIRKPGVRVDQDWTVKIL
ncbi:PREDICTED: probable glucan 1,3-alpha-glucosidase [Camelina sativa]|uniref:Glucosidase II subunit alpha n=1 Tax=Camelina sativa TaxID=90675 RepID=A0ABM0VTY9_CAMSA|nr:PREDICTED: probable glucan 1,3-alpha-glucosidase [Camelina sativa]